MILANLIISSIILALFLLLGLAAIVSSRKNKAASQQALLALLANARQGSEADPTRNGKSEATSTYTGSAG